MVYVTPLSAAFTKSVSSARLGAMLDERQVSVETDFLFERVDPDAKTLVSYDEREIPFDLLVTVPLNMGADFVERSGLPRRGPHVRVGGQHDHVGLDVPGSATAPGMPTASPR